MLLRCLRFLNFCSPKPKEESSHVASHPPALGEHTAQVLQDLGYDAAEIEALSKRGII